MMQSFIIISKDDQKTQEYIDTIVKREKISVFDITILQPESSLGIKDVRDLQPSLYLKPSQGNKKLVILKDAEKATTEAQNAMLKLLEEPPVHLLILLVTSNLDALLPTIQSRCTVINLNPNVSVPDHLISQYPNILVSSVGEKLKLAQDVGKSKETSLEWLSQMMLSLREKLIEAAVDNDPNLPKYLTTMIALQKTHRELSLFNVSPRFALEKTLLSIN